MKKLFAVVLLMLIAGFAFADEKNTWPEEYKIELIERCAGDTEIPREILYCNCVTEQLEKQYDVDEYREIERKMEELQQAFKEEPVSDNLEQIHRSCSSGHSLGVGVTLKNSNQ